MTDKVQYIATLIAKQLNESLSFQEESELDLWLAESDRNRKLFEKINDEAETASALKRFYMFSDNRLSEKIHEAIPGFERQTPATGFKSAHRVHFLKTVWFRYAAALLLIAGTATWFYFKQGSLQGITKNQPLTQPDILPGGNKAILTLSDGSTIILDSVANGNLASQGDTKIIKPDAGSLAYNSGSPLNVGEVLYNTIRTPKGGQYKVVLADGSTVWLNAASSVTFPTAFATNRTIEITGESYLEIAPDKYKPFFVKTAGTTIQVIGTSFNVNAYPEENAVRTTLVTGIVKVAKGHENTLLKPGQQSVITAGAKMEVLPANISKVTAWKNGLFNFEGVGVAELMRQVERWYDVTVEYQSGIPKVEFVGEVKRNTSLSDLLGTLQEMGVHAMQAPGRKIIVLP